MKFRKDATAEKSYIYEFKMALFDNGDLEEFLFFYGTFKWLSRDQKCLLIARIFGMFVYYY